MLRSIKEMRGYVLRAQDGEIGRCKDFLFDDDTWTVRYMVADTGKWLPGRKVLISPLSLRDPNWKKQEFPISLTRSQIEQSPPLESDAPVSKDFERKWHEYYQWSPYWYGGHLWGPGSLPQAINLIPPARDVVDQPDHNLRSAHEVTGYHIEATDGDIGHVEDFIVDDATWTVRYVVVDTRNWLPGKLVIVPPDWARRINWGDRRVYIDLERDTIEKCPEYDAIAPVRRDYELLLHDHYGRPGYWEAIREERQQQR